MLAVIPIWAEGVTVVSEWDDNVTLQLTTTTIAAGLWIISPPLPPVPWKNEITLITRPSGYIRRHKQHADSVSRGRMYIRLAQKAALVGNKVRGATISLNQSSADFFFFFCRGVGEANNQIKAAAIWREQTRF